MIAPLPAHDEAAEAAVIGAVFLAPESFARVSGWLKPEHFYVSRNRLVYRAIVDLAERGDHHDAVTVSREVQARGVPIEEARALVEYGAAIASPASIEHHGRIVRECAGLRSLASGAAEVHQAASSPGASYEDVLALAESRFVGIAGEGGPGSGIAPIRAEAEEALESIEGVRVPQRGTSTGYIALDGIIDGMRPGQLIVAAGRPGMGKSSLAYNIAINVARSGQRAIIFSTEIGRQEIGRSVTAACAKVRLSDIRQGRRLPAEAVMAAREAVSGVAERILCPDRSSYEVSSIRSHVVREVARGGLGLVVVDYIQQVSGPAKAASREQEVSAVSRGLKRLAVEARVPLLALSQLNRESEKREGHSPRLTDLRDSGAIEQDADVVLGLYRPWVYTRASADEGRCEVEVLKNRAGPVGRAVLRFLPEYVRFEDEPIGMVIP